jgi:hypothetical protein
MPKQFSFRQNLKTATEFLAIAAPIICLFDCVILPIAAAFLPFLGLQRMMHGVGDQFLTALVLAICLPVLVPGVMKHRNRSVLIMFTAATCLMLFTNWLGDHIDSILHASLTVATSALLLRANWLNKRLLSCSCSHHVLSHVPITNDDGSHGETH